VFEEEGGAEKSKSSPSDYSLRYQSHLVRSGATHSTHTNSE
jgi:hypothetical protein